MKKRQAFHLVAWLCAFGGVALIGALCRFEFAPPEKTCALCHEIRSSRDRWAESPHKDVNCKECHGRTLEAISDNVKRGVRHLLGADSAKFGSVFCLSERQVEETSARCAKCHQAEAAQWRKSRHGKPASAFLQSEKHNAVWKPADSCLRCHGMFLEGDIERNAVRTDLDRRPAIPCLACHMIHSDDSLQLYSRPERTSFRARNLHLQKIVTESGREVKRADDARTRLCASCHAANAEGIAGSSDDRTPTGEQEGMACMDCHSGHDLKADGERGHCPKKQPQDL